MPFFGTNLFPSAWSCTIASRHARWRPSAIDSLVEERPAVYAVLFYSPASNPLPMALLWMMNFQQRGVIVSF